MDQAATSLFTSAIVPQDVSERLGDSLHTITEAKDESLPHTVLFYLTFVNTLNFLHRYLLPALLPLIMAELALSKEAGGWIVAAFTVGYVFFAPLFGYLGDRLSRTKLMFLGVLLWNLAVIGQGVWGTLVGLLFMRFMLGVGEASFGPLAPSYLQSRLHGAKAISTALAILFCAIPVGAALGYVVAGRLVSAGVPWRSIFLFAGIPGVIASLGMWWCAEGSPPIRSGESGAWGRNLQQLYNVPLLRYAILGYILNAFALNGVAAWISQYGTEVGFTLEEINNAFGLILVGTGFVGTLAGGKVGSYLAGRAELHGDDPCRMMLSYVGWSSLIAVPFMAYGFVAHDQRMFLACSAVAQLLAFAGTGPLNSVLVLTCPPHLVAYTQGVTILMINLFGAALAPPLIGRVGDSYTLGSALQLAPFALALSGLVWCLGAHRCKGKVRP